MTDPEQALNCPNCGRFLRYDAEQGIFTCRCGGIECEKGEKFIIVRSTRTGRTLTLWEA